MNKAYFQQVTGFFFSGRRKVRESFRTFWQIRQYGARVFGIITFFYFFLIIPPVGADGARVAGGTGGTTHAYPGESAETSPALKTVFTVK